MEADYGTQKTRKCVDKRVMIKAGDFRGKRDVGNWKDRKHERNERRVRSADERQIKEETNRKLEIEKRKKM